VLVVCFATPVEGERLVRGLKGARGTLAGREVALLRTGVGPVNAAHALTLLLSRERVRAVVCCGVGGAYPGALDMLDVACAETETYADLGADSPEGKANRDKAMALAKEKGVSAVVESMLPKMLSPKTYPSRPELVARVKAMMESTSLDGVLGDLAGLRDRPDSTPTLATIDRPTLILHGADDQLIPVSEAEAMHAGIKGSQLKILPDAGHLLNMEQPEAFNEAVRQFVWSL